MNPIDLTKLKWPNGPDNLNRSTGEVWMGAGSQSQRFDLGGFHSMTPLGGWPDPTPGMTFDGVKLSYDLTIPDGFEWVHGGKLPGLGGNVADNFPGHSTVYPAEGLNWTVRPMWAEGGRIRLYSWDKTVPAGTYPDGLFTDHPILSPGNTYHIEVRAMMNSVGEADGYASIAVDGRIVMAKKNCEFRATDSLGVDSVVLSVFYGGSGDMYAPKHDQQLTVKNLAWSRIA